MLRRSLLLGALASFALLMAGTDARATYSYTTGAVTLSGGFTGSTSANNAPTQVGGFADGTTVNGQQLVTLTYTPTVQATTTETVSWTQTFNSTIPAGPQAFAVQVVLTLNSSATAVTVTGTSVTVTPGSGSGFSLAFNSYQVQQGSTSGSPGFLSFNFTGPSTIPEPTSVVMLGSGLVGVLGFSVRRMRKQKVASDVSLT